MARPSTYAALLALLMSACTPSWKQTPHDRRFQRVEEPRLHPMPAKNSSWDWWDRLLHAAVLPLGRAISPAAYLRWLTEGRPALDVNDFGQVPDSPWFENRIGRRAMSPAEIARGPNRLGPPAEGTLSIVSGKLEGATPGIVVRDAAGTVWYVKFDPPAYPELTTSAEIIASKILYAAGYHVPEMYLMNLDLERLRLTPSATTLNEYNQRVPLKARELELLLVQLNPGREGRLRGLFSRQIPGRILGPGSFRGVRADDPNDRIPHERRRSLRGLRLFFAWINNTDARRQNSLDTFIPVSGDGERGYVRHYLLDFGDSLGSGGAREKYTHEGYEYRVDWDEIAKQFLSLGLRYPYWYGVQRSPYRAVGLFECRVFSPAKWVPVYPNPAFLEATALDELWAASIIARFTREQLAAIVAVANYSEPGAARWVLRALMKRRTKILRHAFAHVLPLDAPHTEAAYTVVLENLEVVAGLRSEPSDYHFRARWNCTRCRDQVLAYGTVKGPRFDLGEGVAFARAEYGSRFARDPFITLSVWRTNRGRRGPRLDLHLRVTREGLLPVAIERERR